MSTQPGPLKLALEGNLAQSGSCPCACACAHACPHVRAKSTWIPSLFLHWVNPISQWPCPMGLLRDSSLVCLAISHTSRAFVHPCLLDPFCKKYIIITCINDPPFTRALINQLLVYVECERPWGMCHSKSDWTGPRPLSSKCKCWYFPTNLVIFQMSHPPSL